MWKGYPPWKGFGSHGLAWAIGAPWIGGIFRLKFDAQTGTFSVGNTVTGETSGSTGRIVVVQDDGADGILTLDRITGPFLDNEIIYESALGSELITNEGFENPGAGGADIWANWWEGAGSGALANETGSVHGGLDACKITYVTGTAYVSTDGQNIAVSVGDFVKLSFWTRGDGSIAGRFQLYDPTEVYSYTTSEREDTGIAGTAYTEVVRYYHILYNCSNLSFYCHSPSSVGDAYYDDTSLKKITNVALANGMLY